MMTANKTADTVIIKEVLRDTVIEIRADQSMIQALVECDSMGQAHIKKLLDYNAGERLKPPELEIKNNIITSIAKIDSTEIYLTLRDRHKESMKSVEIINTVEVNRLTAWQKWMCTLGHIVLGVSIAFIGINVIKFIR